jgi:hypothetical protein
MEDVARLHTRTHEWMRRESREATSEASRRLLWLRGKAEERMRGEDEPR